MTLEEFRQLKAGDIVRFRDNLWKVVTVFDDSRTIFDGQNVFILREYLMGKTTAYYGFELWELEKVNRDVGI